MLERLRPRQHGEIADAGAADDGNDIGHTGRIILELLPSFFLYPRQASKQKGSPGLHSDPRVADSRGAYAAIRASDERNDLDTVNSL